MKLSPHFHQVEQAYHAMMNALSDFDTTQNSRFPRHGARPRRDLPRDRPSSMVPVIPDQVTPEITLPPLECQEKLLLLAAFEATYHSSQTPISPDMVPLVIDSGASITISPYLTDFIGQLRPVQDVSIQGIASGLQVKGIGTLQYKFFNDSGVMQTMTIPDALFVPKCTARLLCPRQLGHSTGNHTDGFQSLCDKGILTYQGQQTTVSYEPLSQLPMLYTAPGIDTFQRFCTSAFSSQFQHGNLTKNQLRKLHMHERCAHAHWDQINTWIRAGLLPCDPSLANEPDPVCSTCQFGKMHKKSHKTNTGHIGAEHTTPGMGVSSDGMEAGVPGQVFSTHGTPTNKTYKYSTFWIDHYSKFVYVTMHATKRAEDLLQSKLEFEDFASRYGVSISHIRADNGAYTAKILDHDCRKKLQTLSFCAVGAHWQNGVAERFIGTLVTRARTILLHAMAKWPQVVTESMWPFALRYMVNFHNASVLRQKQSTPTPFSLAKILPKPFRIFVSSGVHVMFWLSDYKMGTITKSGNLDVGWECILAPPTAMLAMFHLFIIQSLPISHHNITLHTTKVSHLLILPLTLIMMHFSSNCMRKPYGFSSPSMMMMRHCITSHLSGPTHRLFPNLRLRKRLCSSNTPTREAAAPSLT